MPAVLLVRHAQASFGGPDYDVLSDVGTVQAGVLGSRLAPLALSSVVHGTMQRQRHTAQLALRSRDCGVQVLEDRCWDEYDHEALLDAALAAPDARRAFDEALERAEDPARVFQDALEQALARWCGGAHDGDYRETFAQFRARAADGLRHLLDDLGRSETAVVVTSGGVISALCADFLGLDHRRWAALNRVMVNTGMTKVVHGRRGANLVAVNDHAHLEGRDPSLLTYR
jgi:broad specificity phosphatase PhoE